MNNVETELYNDTPLITASQKWNTDGVNLTKDSQDLYTQNYNTSVRKKM